MVTLKRTVAILVARALIMPPVTVGCACVMRVIKLFLNVIKVTVKQVVAPR